jgi:hypothetical protein
MAVDSAQSYGGETSTMSMPASSTGRRSGGSARSSSRGSIPPGSGVPVPGAEPGIDDVDVDREVDRVRAVEGLGDRVGDDGLGAALLDLGHEVPAQALLAHPLEHGTGGQ